MFRRACRECFGGGLGSALFLGGGSFLEKGGASQQLSPPTGLVLKVRRRGEGLLEGLAYGRKGLPYGGALHPPFPTLAAVC